MDASSQAAPLRVYLDNAATTWPKSAAAMDESIAYVRHCGATAGRGAYRSAQVADRWLSDARTHLARLVCADGAEAVALCNSGTHALNAALWGLLRPGDHVITTGIDHNSLLRPLKNLESSVGIRVSIAAGDAQGFVDPQSAQSLVCADTKWFAIGHASNVTGRIQAIEAWSDLAHRSGARLLVDASQTLGYVPIDMQRSGIDALAAAGHKGLRALAGTGVLVVHRDLRGDFRPLILGGTGLASEQLSAAQSWPQSVEVGNLNLPGVVSLAVAASETQQHLEEYRGLWQARLQQLVDGLRAIPQIQVIGWSADSRLEDYIPVVSLQVAGWDSHDLASVLDSFGIEVRAGWHCAALVHQALGTADTGGTLRMSPGVSTTATEIDYVLETLRQIVA